MSTISLKVTIVISCYNYGNYLEECINSVFSQTYKNIEIIVIDDGSSDNTGEIADKFKGRLRYIRQANRGVVSVRNRALRETNGQYLVQLDADDTLPPEYVEQMVSLAKETNADIVYADYKMFGAKNEKSDFPEFSLEELKNHNFVNVSALVRKSAIGTTRFDEVLSGKTHEDWDFFLAIATKGAKFVKCKTTHLNYRIHDNARNNAFGGLRDQRNYIDVYAYVIDKHIRSKPKQFKYLAGRVFADWYAGIDNLLADERLIHEKELNELAKKNRRLEHSADVTHRKTAPYRLIRYPRTTLYALVRAMRRNSIGKQFHTLQIERMYSDMRKQLASVAKTSSLAVVVHLYYPELWPQIRTSLMRLNNVNGFDLFVSVPVTKHSNKLEQEIVHSFGSVSVLPVPNRGRDVLPFIEIMRGIAPLQYKSVLKLHSKKSPHREDGAEWFGSLLDALVPKQEVVLRSTLDLLEENDTGVIGPAKDYYSLLVNFPANKHHTIKLLHRYAPSAAGRVAYDDRDKYGFFGGTMFWARCDSLQEVVQKSHIRDFEVEAGQIDGTFAHALERAFTVAPALSGKKLFGISTNAVIEVDNESGAIPDWSTEHY